MACCTESKYNLLLTDKSSNLSALKSICEYTDLQITNAQNYLIKYGSFLLKSGPIDEVRKLSLKLAEKSISHEIKKSKY